MLVIADALQRDAWEPRDRRRLVENLLKALRKFAYQKYEEVFRETTDRLLYLARQEPELFPGLADGIEALYDLVRRRNGGDHAG